MRNHVEKRKDMIESVLPSTARRMARAERARLHRRRRRSVNIELTAGSDDPVGVDVRNEVAELIYSRRAADKIAPLERWALALVDRDAALRDAGVEEQVDHFRQLLPDTKIGRHALSHIGSAIRWRAREPWRSRERRPAVTAEDVRRLYERASTTSSTASSSSGTGPRDSSAAWTTSSCSQQPPTPTLRGS